MPALLLEACIYLVLLRVNNMAKLIKPSPCTKKSVCSAIQIKDAQIANTSHPRRLLGVLAFPEQHTNKPLPRRTIAGLPVNCYVRETTSSHHYMVRESDLASCTRTSRILIIRNTAKPSTTHTYKSSDEMLQCDGHFFPESPLTDFCSRRTENFIISLIKPLDFSLENAGVHLTASLAYRLQTSCGIPTSTTHNAHSLLDTYTFINSIRSSLILTIWSSRIKRDKL